MECQAKNTTYHQNTSAPVIKTNVVQTKAKGSVEYCWVKYEIYIVSKDSWKLFLPLETKDARAVLIITPSLSYVNAKCMGLLIWV